MVNVCDSLISLKKIDNNVFMTSKILEAVKNLYLTGKKTWKCRALQNFFIIDHLGRVAGCHVYNPVSSIFDLPKVWNTSSFEALRKTYRECTRCTYLCYIFYSVHGSVLGNIQLAEEQWRNAKRFLKRNSLTHPNSVKPQ
jgi:MoaA/NifB/PqqE/SkfB family radical SAM enzyme